VILRAALRYYALVFGAGFVLGVLRVTLAVPRLGTRWAELLEMPVMLMVIVFAARSVERRDALPREASIRLAVGGVALALLLATEIGLTLALQPGSLQDAIAARDLVSSSVYMAMLLVFALMPWWQGRRL
jgi:hypothetical protein